MVRVAKEGEIGKTRLATKLIIFRQPPQLGMVIKILSHFSTRLMLHILKRVHAEAPAEIRGLGLGCDSIGRPQA